MKKETRIKRSNITIEDKERLTSYFLLLMDLVNSNEEPLSREYRAELTKLDMISHDPFDFLRDYDSIISLIKILRDIGDQYLDLIRNGCLLELDFLIDLDQLKDWEFKNFSNCQKISQFLIHKLRAIGYSSIALSDDDKPAGIQQKNTVSLAGLTGIFLSVCFLGKKLTLNSLSSGSDQIAYQKWMQVNQKNKEFDYDKLSSSYILLGKILMKDLRISNHVPYPLFSNGSIAGSTGALDQFSKYNCMRSNKYLEKHFPDIHLGCLPDDEEQLSELIFVPKGIDSRRPICKESASRNFLQRSFEYDLEKYIANHNILSRVITLESQQRSQDITILASKLGVYSTLDLSSASDSVSVYHIYPLLPKECLDMYYASRVSKVAGPEGEVSILSSSPQGSCVNFPLETICFTTYLLSEILTYEFPEWDYGWSGGSYDFASNSEKLAIERKVQLMLDTIVEKYAGLSVYGDDIICPTSISLSLIDTLERNNFIVNKDKSFFNSDGYLYFRESCGTFALNGIEVKILILSRNFLTFRPRFFDKRNRFARWFANEMNIQLLNNLPAKDCYSKLRRHILKEMLWEEFPILFSKSSFGIHTVFPENNVYKVNDCYFTKGIIQKVSTKRLDDHFSYLCTLIRMHNAPDETREVLFRYTKNEYSLRRVHFTIL